MKIKQVNRLAEIISHSPTLPERARLAQQIGLICREEIGPNFDWDRWNQVCKINEVASLSSFLEDCP